MGRRMYSESQISRMIDSKLKDHARIPTDLAADDQPTASLIHLQDNVGVIGDSVYLKKILGNSIIGEGSVDLYNHHIQIDSRSGKISCCFTLVSSKSIAGTSAQNFGQLLGTTQKPISCSGYFRKENGTEANVIAIDWKGTLSASKLYLSDGAHIDFPAAEVVIYTDVVESV